MSDPQTQASYSETPYSDTSWEIVGEKPSDNTFLPMEVEILTGRAEVADPMFADYGGLPLKDAERRWHLPDELGIQTSQRLAEEAAPPQPMVELHPDEFQKLLSEAREQGQAEAKQAAEAAHAAEIEQLQTRMSEVVQQLGDQLETICNSTEKAALDLSLQIAHRLVGHAVEINPEYIVAILKDALSQVGGGRVLKVKVSPQDMEFIELIGPKRLLKDFDESWQFEADPAIVSGCVLESSAGQVDYQIEAAWQRIKDSVLKAIR